MSKAQCSMLNAADHKSPHSPLPTPHSSRLIWPKRPTIKQHALLGRKRIWQARGLPLRIVSFEGGSGLLLTEVRDALGWKLVDRHRRLLAAQRAAARIAADLLTTDR